MQHRIQLHHGDNIELMATLPDASIDVICIDPPYLYLKGQKLERAFDEQRFFAECARLLTKDGFIILFGRGASFYRWNTILAELGFAFKEEVIWDKNQTTSPLLSMTRVHETVAIWSKGKGAINKVKVPYLEMKSHDLDAIIVDIKRLKTILNNTKSLDAVLSYLEDNKHIYQQPKKHKTSVSVQPSHLLNTERSAACMQYIKEGLNEKSIIRSDFAEASVMDNKSSLRAGACNEGNRCVNMIQTISAGMNEKTIIKEQRNHYSAIHPTEKPVRLLERLMALVLPKDKPRNEIVVADFFGGSMSCMEAAWNMGLNGIASEIDKEYFDSGKERIDKLTNQATQTLFPAA
jgi:site-specific DNA-methyltransferase (adenine-specific)